MSNVKLDASTDIYKGQLHLFFGDTPLAFGKTASLEITAEEIDITNKMLGDWGGALSGKKSFSLQADAFYSKKGESFDSLFAKFEAGTPVDFTFSTATSEDQDSFGGTFTASEDVKFSGKVIVTSLSLQSNAGEYATFTATLKGVGKLKNK